MPDVERVETTTVAQAMRGERSFIEVPPVSDYVTVSPAVQDWRDGEALRKLVDAARSYMVEVVWMPNPGKPTPHWLCRVSDAEWSAVVASAYGDTPAEAIDDCRAALESVAK